MAGWLQVQRSKDWRGGERRLVGLFIWGFCWSNKGGLPYCLETGFCAIIKVILLTGYPLRRKK